MKKLRKFNKDLGFVEQYNQLLKFLFVDPLEMIVFYSGFQSILYSNRHNNNPNPNVLSPVDKGEYEKSCMKQMISFTKLMNKKDEKKEKSKKTLHEIYPLKGCMFAAMLSGLFLTSLRNNDKRKLISSFSPILWESLKFKNIGNLKRKNNFLLEEFEKNGLKSKVFEKSVDEVVDKVMDGMKDVKRTGVNMEGKLFLICLSDVVALVGLNSKKKINHNFTHVFSLLVSCKKDSKGENKIVACLYQAFSPSGVKVNKEIYGKEYKFLGKNALEEGKGYSLYYWIRNEMSLYGEKELIDFLNNFKFLMSCKNDRSFNEKLYKKLFKVEFEKERMPKKNFNFCYCYSFDVTWNDVVDNLNYLFIKICSRCKNKWGNNKFKCLKCLRKYYCSLKCQKDDEKHKIYCEKLEC